MKILNVTSPFRSKRELYWSLGCYYVDTLLQYSVICTRAGSAEMSLLRLCWIFYLRETFRWRWQFEQSHSQKASSKTRHQYKCSMFSLIWHESNSLYILPFARFICIWHRPMMRPLICFRGIACSVIICGSCIVSWPTRISPPKSIHTCTAWHK